MTPQLYARHRAALMAAARKDDHPEFSKQNAELDDVIARIKAEQPELFLTAEDLPARCFVHTPATRYGRAPTPYARALRTGLTPVEVAEQVRYQRSRAAA